jgi:hypothetical protein
MMDGLLTVCLAQDRRDAVAKEGLELREKESAKEDDSISNDRKLG